LTVDDKGAVKAVQDFDKAIEGLGKQAQTAKTNAGSFGQDFMGRLIPAFTAGTLAAGAIKAGLRFVKDQIVETAQAAMESERTFQALSSALEITGRTVPGMGEDLAKYAGELQKVTIYDDEAIKRTETLLAQMTNLDGAGIKRATRGAIGLASVLGIDLNSATMMVTKAMEGNFMALQRYGIRVSENLPLDQKRTELMERLEKMFQRATDETNTASGSLAQLNNTIDESKEKIGTAFLPIFTMASKTVSGLLADIVGLDEELQKMGGDQKKLAAKNEVYADAF